MKVKKGLGILAMGLAIAACSKEDPGLTSQPGPVGEDSPAVETNARYLALLKARGFHTEGAWKTEALQAINIWNSLGSNIYLHPVTSNPHITLYSDMAPGMFLLPDGVGGLTGGPNNGLPNPVIMVNGDDPGMLANPRTGPST